jgi:hypothetical protein
MGCLLMDYTRSYGAGLRGHGPRGRSAGYTYIEPPRSSERYDRYYELRLSCSPWMTRKAWR